MTTEERSAGVVHIAGVLGNMLTCLCVPISGASFCLVAVNSSVILKTLNSPRSIQWRLLQGADSKSFESCLRTSPTATGFLLFSNLGTSILLNHDLGERFDRVASSGRGGDQ